MRKTIKYGGISRLLSEATLFAIGAGMIGTAFSLYTGFKVFSLVANGKGF